MKLAALTAVTLLAGATAAAAQGLTPSAPITREVPAAQIYAPREAAEIGTPFVPVTTGVVKSTPADEVYSPGRIQRTEYRGKQLISRTIFPAGPADRFNDR
ncbi:hypothetical protein [Maritimibacter alkaliphilus]|uniref:hypothetical protein n=1 Tax=Maritimibacter alkaliphilus TaxID=404236 RepID=UPI001C94E693|nr:hypothetical protein [Maritimibacter alkaliphilus]MBY6093063.1 hypothetical protein [Maritimibacter alkaliphilus]